MKNTPAFDKKSVSADLELVEIHQFDIHDFSSQFSDWLNQMVFSNLNSEPLEKIEKDSSSQTKIPVIFSISQKLEIDSADLALILEVARQQNLIPLGFINNSKVVADYALFTNLVLFDENYFDQSKQRNKQIVSKQSEQMKKKIGQLEKQLEVQKNANEQSPDQLQSELNSQNPTETNQLDLNFDLTSEKFYKNIPLFIKGDIWEDLELEEVTFISGNVFLPVDIHAKDNLYIFGTCFGQVSVSSELGQVYIEKLRARRIKIGPYHIESSQYDAELIDQAVVFYINNNQIEYKIINE